MSSFRTKLQYEFTGSYQTNRPLYVLTADLIYDVGGTFTPVARISVPSGFITDFASIPWPIDLIFKPNGNYTKAAVIHDFLVQNKCVSFMVVDAIFFEAELVLKVNKILARAFYYAVRFYHTFVDKNRNRIDWLKIKNK